MELAFKGTRYEPTPEIIEQATKQIQPLGRFLGKDYTEARALLELERAVGGKQKGGIWRAELTIDHDGKQHRAESTKAKLPHAVTTVVRDLKSVLARTGRKEHTFLRKGGAAVKEFLRGFGR